MLIKTTVTLQDEHIFGWHTKVHSQRQNSVASIDHSCLESGKKKKKGGGVNKVLSHQWFVVCFFLVFNPPHILASIKKTNHFCIVEKSYRLLLSIIKKIKSLMNQCMSFRDFICIQYFFITS